MKRVLSRQNFRKWKYTKLVYDFKNSNLGLQDEINFFFPKINYQGQGLVLSGPKLSNIGYRHKPQLPEGEGLNDFSRRRGDRLNKVDPIIINKETFHETLETYFSRYTCV